MPDYDITIADIKRYLTSLQPDQVVGQVQKPRACLVEKALEHKYPGTQFHVNSTYARPIHVSGYDFDLSPDVQDVVTAFDNLGETNLEGDVVSGLEFPIRSQVEEAIPVLKGEGTNA